MNPKGKCQSCGMPLKADPKGGGTRADGSVSTDYCSYCYADGKFISPGMTLVDARALVVDKLRQKDFSKFFARFFASGLNRLSRWRSPRAPLPV